MCWIIEISVSRKLCGNGSSKCLTWFFEMTNWSALTRTRSFVLVHSRLRWRSDADHWMNVYFWLSFELLTTARISSSSWYCSELGWVIAGHTLCYSFICQWMQCNGCAIIIYCVRCDHKSTFSFFNFINLNEETKGLVVVVLNSLTTFRTAITWRVYQQIHTCRPYTIHNTIIIIIFFSRWQMCLFDGHHIMCCTN